MSNIFSKKNLALICIGVLLGIIIVFVSVASKKWIFMLSCGLLLGFALILTGNQWKKVLLFFMVLVASINIDVNFFVFEDHVGGANGLRISAIFVLLVILYVPFLYSVVRGRERIRFIGWITVPLMMYFFFALLSALNAVEPLLSVYQVLQLFQAYLIFLYLSNNLGSENDFFIVLCAVSAALAMQGLMALGQQYASAHFNIQFFGGAEETMVEVVGGKGVKRPSGLLMHPILLANFVFLELPLCLGIAAFSRNILMRVLMVVASLLGVSALFLTMSRGAWIGMTVTLTLLVIISAYKRVIRISTLVWSVLGGILLIIPALALKWKSIYMRFTESLEGPVVVRFELADIAFQMFREHPLIGTGINNFTQIVQYYERLTTFVSEFRHPVHNIYLLELSETGIIGIFFFLLVLYGVFRISAVAMKHPLSRLRYVAIAVTCSFTAFLITGIADWSYRVSAMNVIFWTNIGILGAIFLQATGKYATFPGAPVQTGREFDDSRPLQAGVDRCMQRGQ